VQSTQRTTPRPKEERSLKAKGGIIGGTKEENSTSRRGKTLLEERKTKIGMGKEIDTIRGKKTRNKKAT